MLKDRSTGKVEGHCFEETQALLVLGKARAGGGVLHLSSGMVASNSTRARPRSLGFCSLAFKCHGQVRSALTIQGRDGVSSVCVQLTSEIQGLVLWPPIPCHLLSYASSEQWSLSYSRVQCQTLWS